MRRKMMDLTMDSGIQINIQVAVEIALGDQKVTNIFHYVRHQFRMIEKCDLNNFTFIS